MQSKLTRKEVHLWIVQLYRLLSILKNLFIAYFFLYGVFTILIFEVRCFVYNRRKLAITVVQYTGIAKYAVCSDMVEISHVSHQCVMSCRRLNQVAFIFITDWIAFMQVVID